MRVSTTSEALLGEQVAEREIGNLFQRDVMLTQQPTNDGGYAYSLTFKGGSLKPEAAYAVMQTAAPYDGDFETPRGVIDDWKEPDNHTEEARARIKRHEKMLGQNWDDFMLSRTVFMEVVEAVPELGLNEQEVHRITDADETADFAATYLVNPDNPDIARKMLSNAELDTKHRTAIWDTIRPFLKQPSTVFFRNVV